MRYFSRSYHTIIRTFSKKMRGMKLTKKMLFSKKSVASLVMAGILAGVIIFFYFNSSGLRAKAAWFNDHWMYRKAYTIDNTGSAQTNKKIKLDIDTSSLISGGKMQSSCQDSRFTTASGQTIPYYRFDAPASGTATFVDDTEYTSSTSGTTETFSHTVSEGDDRYLVVAISMLRSHSLGIRDQTKDIFVTSMYYGDQRMIRLVADNNNDTNRNRSVELWGLVNPDVGTHDISVTITPHNNRWVISAMNFTGVDQLDPTGGWGANATSSAVSTLSASVTTESANSLIVGTGYIQNDDGGTLSLATGTETFEQSTGVSGVDLRANGGYRTTTTAGAYTFQVDATGSQQMGVAAVELKNATGDFSNINLVNISRYDADNLASTTGSFDHQVPTDVEDPVLVVFVHAFTANSNAHLNDINLNTLTYNGDSMTEQVAYDHSSTNRRGYFAIWTLPNPDEGLNTLSLTFNITVFDVEAFAITYSGVNQSTPVGGTNSAGAGAGVASVSTSVSTSYANSLLVGSGFWSTTNSQTTSSGDYSTVTVKNDETLFQGATDIKTDYPLSVGGGQRVTSSTGSYDFQLDFSNGTTSTTFAAVVAAELNPATNRTSSDACGGSSTDYQLLMDSIPAGKSVIYHYYGNPTVGNISKISGFTQSLFTPNSTTAGSEQQSPGPLVYFKLDEGVDNSCPNGGDACSSASATYNGAKAGAVWESNSCVSGSCLYFDDDQDYFEAISGTTGTDSFEVDEFTVSAWVKATDSPNIDGGVVINTYGWNGTGTAQRGWYLGDAYGSDDLLELRIYDSSGNSAGAAYSGFYAEYLNEWVYVTGVYSNSGDYVKLYINGELYSSTSSTIVLAHNSSARHLRVGARSDTTSQGEWEGYLDEVKFFTYARTADEIKADYNSLSSKGIAANFGSDSQLNLSDGLVGYWKMDEGYGTTANDSSGQSNNFTLSAANWTNNGKYGKAFNGDGAAYASMSDNATYDITASSDYSISLWFQSDSASNPGTTEYLINKANATTAGYAVYANTSGYLCFGIDDDATWNPDISSCTTTDYYDSTWHHLVAVRDSGGSDKTYVYIDGVLKDSDSDTTTATLANSLSLYLADRDGTNNGDEFNGQLDDVKIYNYALTAAEVAADYNQAKTASFGTLSTASDGTTADNSAARSFCVPGDTTSCNPPVLEYKFDENTGTTSTYDTSGNGYTGTLTSITSGSWVPGAYGSALQFDGSADYVSVPGTPLNTSQSTGTISAWVKPLDATDTEGIFSTLENRDRYMFIDGSTFKASMYDGTGATFRILSGGTVDTNWHFITFSWDIGNGSLKFYVDGVLADSYSGSSWTTAGTASGTYLARSTSANSNMPATDYFEGSIDQFIIYDYVRTPAQIAWEYNRGAPIAHYKFDECQGSTFYNSAVTGRDTVAGYNLIPTIGASGTNTSLGTCSSGTGTEAWNNGTTGKYGASMSFDGTDDRGEYTNSQNLTSRFTISAWVKSDDFTPQMYVYEIEYGLPALVTANNYIRITMRDAGNTTWNNYNSSAVLNDGEWNHIAVTYDTPNIVHYINGVPVGTGSHTGPMGGWASTDNTWIGGRSSVWFDGQIDDVQVYNYALTATQVRNLMNRGAVSFK